MHIRCGTRRKLFQQPRFVVVTATPAKAAKGAHRMESLEACYVELQGLVATHFTTIVAILMTPAMTM